MSRENVEIVQALFDTWNAGDMEAYRELLDPKVIVRGPREWPETGPWVGPEAVLGQYLQMRDTWAVDTLESVGDFIDMDGRVLVRLIWRGEGQGPAMNLEVSCVYTMRDGKNCGQDFFLDHAEAIEAAGLP